MFPELRPTPTTMPRKSITACALAIGSSKLVGRDAQHEPMHGEVGRHFNNPLRSPPGCESRSRTSRNDARINWNQHAIKGRADLEHADSEERRGLRRPRRVPSLSRRPDGCGGALRDLQSGQSLRLRDDEISPAPPWPLTSERPSHTGGPGFSVLFLLFRPKASNTRRARLLVRRAKDFRAARVA